MKIAIISDIHGNLEALKATIKDIKSKKVDKIYCLGDIIAKGYHIHECIEIVKKECEVVLKGNCDRHFTEPINEVAAKNETEKRRWEILNERLNDDEVEYLRNLPYSCEFYLSGSLIRLFHATPEKDNVVVITQDSIDKKYKMFLPSEKTISKKEADIIAYGHIHHQYMDKLYNKTLLNVGSVGNSFCLIRNDQKDSDIREIRQAHYVILEGKYGDKEYSDSISIQFVKVPYDVYKELEEGDEIEKDIFENEVLNGTYRNMTKINQYFEDLGLNPNDF